MTSSIPAPEAANTLATFASACPVWGPTPSTTSPSGVTPTCPAAATTSPMRTLWLYGPAGDGAPSVRPSDRLMFDPLIGGESYAPAGGHPRLARQGSADRSVARTG